MTGTFQPLDSKFAIVDRNGNPTAYFIRWAQQKQIDIGSSITLTDLADYLAAHPLIAGTGIQFTPDGNIADGVNIHADVQAILDEITATRGAVIYRGIGGWAALLPGVANQVLQTNGPGADPSWVTPAAGGGGGFALLGSAISTGVSGVLSVSAIPATYKDLIVTITGRTTSAALQNIALDVTGSPLTDMQRWYVQNTTPGYDQLLATAGNTLTLQFPGTGFSAGMISSLEISILEYAATTFWKNFHWHGRQVNSVTPGNAFDVRGSGEFRTLAALAAVSATLAAGNWVTGSTMRVYGRGS